uniref:Outer membrane protein assembly factor BamB n=1 Tax=Candidatus Kentrum sp. TUN TaxID=2126343 RepID=A0A450ZV27_9GAMM|nr:MAG: Beta-barrel assembly machine subunit BamB [Candidatus Kentron sp. TUN]VFK54581.1 MAG: Beta-barrel assembly machine subunit BamB [Candidatus Kentron sp. TUN]VFK57613.1 MAG: Beta-barrel assembly machine subunit BamB [Candidatus Kentron sp. TUN]
MQDFYYPRLPLYDIIRRRTIAWFTVMGIIGLLISLSGCGTIGAWGKDDKKTELSPAPLAEFQPQVQIQKLWQRKIGVTNDDPYVKLIPAVRQNRLFIATLEGDVQAYDAQTGKLLWKTNIDIPIRGGPGVGNSTVLVGSNNGDVVALSQDTGETLWEAKVSSEVLAVPREKHGVVIARTVDGKLFGLNQEDGIRRWVYQRSVPILTLRGTSAPVLTEDFAIAGFDSGQLVAISIKDGYVVWETRIALPTGRSDIERMVDIDGELTIIGNAIYVVTFQGQVAAVDVASGGIFWKREMSSHAGLGVHGETLYVTDAQSHLWALNRHNGEPQWHQTGLEHRRLTAPVGFRPMGLGNYVAVGDFEGYLHILNADDGHFMARVRADKEGIAAQPIITRDTDTLYVYGNGGILTAFRIME